MIRVLARAPLGPAPGRVPLDAAELRHLEVRRAELGQGGVLVLDGQGAIGSGRVGSDGKQAWVDLEEVRRVGRPADLALLVGAGDRDRFLWLTEKAQELGVTRLVPVITERARSVATRIKPEHRERLERRAREAMKQSGNPWLLAIEPPVELADALRGVEAPVRWLADQAGGAAPPGSGGLPAVILVGPEGGLTPAEREAAREAGFAPVGLGAHGLRFETAAIIAAGVLTARRRAE